MFQVVPDIQKVKQFATKWLKVTPKSGKSLLKERDWK